MSDTTIAQPPPNTAQPAPAPEPDNSTIRQMRAATEDANKRAQAAQAELDRVKAEQQAAQEKLNALDREKMTGFENTPSHGICPACGTTSAPAA